MHRHVEPVWAAVKDAAQGGTSNIFYFFSLFSNRLETGAVPGVQGGANHDARAPIINGAPRNQRSSWIGAEFSSQIPRLLVASLIQNPSFLYISLVFVHVVALFLEQMSPGSPTAVQTFPLTSRKDSDPAQLHLSRTNVSSSTAVD